MILHNHLRSIHKNAPTPLVNAHLNSKLILVGTEKNTQYPKWERPGLDLEAQLLEGTLLSLFYSWCWLSGAQSCLSAHT